MANDVFFSLFLDPNNLCCLLPGPFHSLTLPAWLWLILVFMTPGPEDAIQS